MSENSYDRREFLKKFAQLSSTTLLFSLTGCALYGPGPEYGPPSEDEYPDTTFPIMSVSEIENEYRQLIKQPFEDSKEFSVQEGLLGLDIGIFLKDNTIVYQSAVSMKINQYLFPNLFYKFRTDVLQSFNSSTPAISSLPVISTAQNSAKELSSVSTIEYELSFEDMYLDTLSEPNDLIELEAEHTSNSNRLIYGVYEATMRINIRLYNSKSRIITPDTNFIYRILNSEQEIKELTHIMQGQSCIFETNYPVEIGFLIRKINEIV